MKPTHITDDLLILAACGGTVRGDHGDQLSMTEKGWTAVFAATFPEREKRRFKRRLKDLERRGYLSYRANRGAWLSAFNKFMQPLLAEGAE